MKTNINELKMHGKFYMENMFYFNSKGNPLQGYFHNQTFFNLLKHFHSAAIAVFNESLSLWLCIWYSLDSPQAVIKSNVNINEKEQKNESQHGC